MQGLGTGLLNPNSRAFSSRSVFGSRVLGCVAHEVYIKATRVNMKILCTRVSVGHPRLLLQGNELCPDLYFRCCCHVTGMTNQSQCSCC